MPDYNPAVAAGYQPPQSNLLPTLEGIAQLQIGQAHAGLYSLQALQQQRQFNALQAAANAYRSGADPVGAYLGEGGEPSGANSLQGLYTNQRAMALTPHHLMPGQENELAQYGGNVAKSAGDLEEYHSKIRSGAAQVANGYLSNPSPASKQAMVEYTRQHQGDDAADEVAKLSDDELMGRAKEYVGRGLTAEQGAQTVQTENQQGAPVYQTRSQFLAGPQTGGTVGANPQQKKQQEYYATLNRGIQALGDASAPALDDIRIAKAAMSDPNFFSGQGASYNLMAKRFLALGLGDPAGAQPQEILKKVMAASMQQQIVQMKAAAEEMGASSSRLFEKQIQLMQDASSNPDITLASNRFLAELGERTLSRNVRLADTANNYHNGILDPKFENQFRKDASAPLFSNWELSHLDTIGAPMADRLAKIDPQEIQWFRTHANEPSVKENFDRHYGPGAGAAALRPALAQ